jgi:ribonucleoside-diphosphate reductase alpha chain
MWLVRFPLKSQKLLGPKSRPAQTGGDRTRPACDNEQLGYAKSIMDYLFRWLELRFLSGTQLPLFVTTEATSANAGEVSNRTPRTGVSALIQDGYELGDAPLCSTCGALMVRNGGCYKCVNCGGTTGCS